MVRSDLSKRTGLFSIEGATLVVALVLLASCAGPAGTAAPSPGTVTDWVTPTPTPAPYWDLLPLTSQPEGGWKTYRNEEMGLSFQYPAVYDGRDCGQILLFDKVYEDAPTCTVVGFGSFRIHMWEDWAGDLAERAAALQTGSELQLLTAVEPFSIGGVPALRVVFHNPPQADLVYAKGAWAAFGGRLYEFSYLRMLSYPPCDAPPLSEEEVYEYLLSTFKFVP